MSISFLTIQKMTPINECQDHSNWNSSSEGNLRYSQYQHSSLGSIRNKVKGREGRFVNFMCTSYIRLWSTFPRQFSRYKKYISNYDLVNMINNLNRTVLVFSLCWTIDGPLNIFFLELKSILKVVICQKHKENFRLEKQTMSF